MAYIDNTYYTDTFHGMSIPEEDFPRLAETASDLIDSIVQKPVPLISGEAPEDVKRATAYEVECLFSQGGLDAATGFAAGISAQSESLGNYSVGRGGASSSSGAAISVPSHDGIPVSSMTISLLRKAGLMCRWAYAGGGNHAG